MRFLVLFLLSFLLGAGFVIPTEPVDLENAPMMRIKTAPLGWTLEVKSYDFETCHLSSLVNRKEDNTDSGDATIKFYKSNGDEITTQEEADTACVKTVIDWEPNHDYEIAGGRYNHVTDLSSDAFLNVVAVPDLPYSSGGSRVLVSGFNLKHLAKTQLLQIEGRSSKRLNYNATYHTNKIRAIVYTEAGVKIDIQAVFEIFKP